MDSYSSNVDHLMESIRRKVLGFGFDSHASTGGGTVGDRCAQTIAQDIHDRSLQGEGPDGAWEPNADSTVKRKGGRNTPNIDTGEMVSTEQIAGEVTSTPSECQVRYGKDEENRKKAGFAHEGQSRSKVIRRFFALDDDIRRDLRGVLREELADHLQRGSSP